MRRVAVSPPATSERVRRVECEAIVRREIDMWKNVYCLIWMDGPRALFVIAIRAYKSQQARHSCKSSALTCRRLQVRPLLTVRPQPLNINRSWKEHTVAYVYLG